MIKSIVRSAVVASLTVGGMIVLAAGPASAATTIVAGPGSTAACTTNATAKLAPSLKNDWVASPSDSVPVVAALPNTQFASPGPVVTSAKGTATCTGTATDGINTAPIVGIKKLTVVTDPAHPGTTDEATCASLLAGGSTAEFITTIEWTSGNGDKIADTTITDSSLVQDGFGFEFTGGTATGSFAGGTFSSVSPASAALIAELLQPQETGAQAEAGTYTSLGCEPTLKVKVKNGVATSATFKAPKGLKEIVTSDGSLDASA
ncbi:MAG: hypothetical protein ABSC90_15435 [Acidimicrobiales bacterium]|jgi:hypothetical protein